MCVYERVCVWCLSLDLMNEWRKWREVRIAGCQMDRKSEWWEIRIRRWACVCERERSSMSHVCVLCMDQQTCSAWMNINSACVKVCKYVCLVFRRSSAPARSAAELIHLTVPVQQSIHSHWQHNTLSLSLMRDSINPHTHCTVRHSLQPTAVSTAHTHTSACRNTHTRCYLLSNISFIKLFDALRSQTFHVRCYIFRGKLISKMLGGCGWLSWHCYLVGKVFWVFSSMSHWPKVKSLSSSLYDILGLLWDF